jgi:transposase
MTIPGVDVAVAVSVVAAVGDFSRFASPDKLVAYLGLNPTVRQSGNGPAIHGRITKAVGLPRRPADVRLPRKLALVAGLSAVVFPQWGITALAVVGLDRFVIRRITRLRAAFGER